MSSNRSEESLWFGLELHHEVLNLVFSFLVFNNSYLINDFIHIFSFNFFVLIADELFINRSKKTNDCIFTEKCNLRGSKPRRELSFSSFSLFLYAATRSNSNLPFSSRDFSRAAHLSAYLFMHLFEASLNSI